MPHKFAEKVLDLELEIEKGSFSMDVVNDLEASAFVGDKVSYLWRAEASKTCSRI